MPRSSVSMRIAAVCLLVSSCTLDARKQAVDEVVAFGLESPFTVIQIDRTMRPSLAIADSALEQYNRIFDYLPRSEDIDSARYYYELWMNVLLSEGTFSAVERVEYALEADTLVARIAVRRPELAGFEETVLSRLGAMDAGTLTERIQRAKRELVIRDTLELRVLAGPRIVAWSSALRRRDSVAFAEAAPTLPPSGPQPIGRPDGSVVDPVAISEGPERLEPLADPADSTITMWIDVRNAHIRSGPGIEHEVIAVRPQGTHLVADSLTDRWYRVRETTGKVEGFIAGSLVSVDSVAPLPAEPSPEPERQTKGVAAAQS